MPYLKEQVDIINNHLKTKGLNDARFSRGLIVDLAEQAVVQDTEETRQYPYYKNKDGRNVEISINDNWPFIIYHRHDNSDFENVEGYGSDNTEEKEIARMMMVVYGQEGAVNMSKEQFASFINLAMPNNISSSLLTGLKLKSMEVIRESSDVNSLRVFGEEYSGVDFSIEPGSFLLKINYTIETEYRKNCFNLCDCE